VNSASFAKFLKCCVKRGTTIKSCKEGVEFLQQ
jgi:hypothetical protein